MENNAEENIYRKRTGKRKAATAASRNISVKSSSSIGRVQRLLRKKKHCSKLTDDDEKFLKNHADLVKQFYKRRERRNELLKRQIEREDSPEEIKEKCLKLAQAIHDSEFLVVYTGAGISTSASIPDYRGPNGIWTRLSKGEDIGTHDLTTAKPTLTHMALSHLYEKNIVRHVVSQNCDGLHMRSGLPKTALSEVHGNMYIEVCCKCASAREYVRIFDTTENTSKFQHTTGRRCYRCGEPLIDSIVHFGERGRLRWPINWQGACQAARACDTILCLGSSLKVLRKYTWLWQVDRKKRPKLHIVNLQWTPKDSFADVKINGKCDEVMKQVMNYLGFNVPDYSNSLDPIFDVATPLHPEEMGTVTGPCIVTPSSCTNFVVEAEINKRVNEEGIKENSVNFEEICKNSVNFEEICRNSVKNSVNSENISIVTENILDRVETFKNCVGNSRNCVQNSASSSHTSNEKISDCSENSKNCVENLRNWEDFSKNSVNSDCVENSKNFVENSKNCLNISKDFENIPDHVRNCKGISENFGDISRNCAKNFKNNKFLSSTVQSTVRCEKILEHSNCEKVPKNSEDSFSNCVKNFTNEELCNNSIENSVNCIENSLKFSENLLRCYVKTQNLLNSNNCTEFLVNTPEIPVNLPEFSVNSPEFSILNSNDSKLCKNNEIYCKIYHEKLKENLIKIIRESKNLNGSSEIFKNILEQSEQSKINGIDYSNLNYLLNFMNNLNASNYFNLHSEVNSGSTGLKDNNLKSNFEFLRRNFLDLFQKKNGITSNGETDLIETKKFENSDVKELCTPEKLYSNLKEEIKSEGSDAELDNLGSKKIKDENGDDSAVKELPKSENIDLKFDNLEVKEEQSGKIGLKFENLDEKEEQCGKIDLKFGNLNVNEEQSREINVNVKNLDVKNEPFEKIEIKLDSTNENLKEKFYGTGLCIRTSEATDSRVNTSPLPSCKNTAIPSFENFMPEINVANAVTETSDTIFLQKNKGTLLIDPESESNYLVDCNSSKLRVDQSNFESNLGNFDIWNSNSKTNSQILENNVSNNFAQNTSFNDSHYDICVSTHDSDRDTRVSASDCHDDNRVSAHDSHCDKCISAHDSHRNYCDKKPEIPHDFLKNRNAPETEILNNLLPEGKTELSKSLSDVFRKSRESGCSCDLEIAQPSCVHSKSDSGKLQTDSQSSQMVKIYRQNSRKFKTDTDSHPKEVETDNLNPREFKTCSWEFQSDSQEPKKYQTDNYNSNEPITVSLCFDEPQTLIEPSCTSFCNNINKHAKKNFNKHGEENFNKTQRVSKNFELTSEKLECTDKKVESTNKYLESTSTRLESTDNNTLPNSEDTISCQIVDKSEKIWNFEIENGDIRKNNFEISGNFNKNLENPTNNANIDHNISDNFTKGILYNHLKRETNIDCDKDMKNIWYNRFCSSPINENIGCDLKIEINSVENGTLLEGNFDDHDYSGKNELVCDKNKIDNKAPSFLDEEEMVNDEISNFLDKNENDNGKNSNYLDKKEIESDKKTDFSDNFKNVSEKSRYHLRRSRNSLDVGGKILRKSTRLRSQSLELDSVDGCTSTDRPVISEEVGPADSASSRSTGDSDKLACSNNRPQFFTQKDQILDGKKGSFLDGKKGKILDDVIKRLWFWGFDDSAARFDQVDSLTSANPSSDSTQSSLMDSNIRSVRTSSEISVPLVRTTSSLADSKARSVRTDSGTVNSSDWKARTDPIFINSKVRLSRKELDLVSVASVRTTSSIADSKVRPVRTDSGSVNSSDWKARTDPIFMNSKVRLSRKELDLVINSTRPKSDLNTDLSRSRSIFDLATPRGRPTRNSSNLSSELRKEFDFKENIERLTRSRYKHKMSEEIDSELVIPNENSCNCLTENSDLCKKAETHKVNKEEIEQLETDTIKAREALNKRRIVNYKKFSPVFELKLESIVYTRKKRKYKRELYETDESSEEEDNKEGIEKEVEKKGDKNNPGWYGKGHRKVLKRRK